MGRTSRPNVAMPYTLPKHIRRLIAATAALLAIGIIVLVTAGIFVYRHPYTVLPLLSKGVTAWTGLAVSAEVWSINYDPLCLNARGVRIRPAQGERDVELSLDSIKVSARIFGPFGHRTLSVEEMRVEGFDGSLLASGPTVLSLGVLFEPGPPSVIRRLTRRLVRWLLFAEIGWAGLEMTEGRIAILGDSWHLASAGIALKMTPREGLDIRGGPLEVDAGPGTRLVSSGFQLHLEPRDLPTTGSVTGRLRATGGGIQTPLLVGQDLSVDAQLIYHPDRSEVQLTTVDLRGWSIAVHKAREIRLPQHKTAFSASGRWRLAERTLELPEWTIDIQETITASGRARLDVSPPYHLQIDVVESRIKNREIKELCSLLPDSSALRPLILSGDTHLKGEAAGPLTGPLDQWRGDFDLATKSAALDYHTATTRLAAKLNANLSASGPLSRLRFKIGLEADNLSIAGFGAALTGFYPRLTIVGRFPDLDIALRTRGAGTLDTAGGNRFEQVAIAFDEGRVDLQSLVFSLPRISLTTATLTNLSASLRGRPDKGALAVQGRGSGIVRTAVSLGMLPAGWKWSAEDDFELALDWQPTAGVSLKGRMALTDLRFSGPDENRIGEGLKVTIESTSRFRFEDKLIRARTNFSAAGGEVLWGRYYIDLGAMPVTGAGQIKWDMDRKLAIVDRLTASLGDLVALSASGSLQPTAGGKGMDIVVKAAETDAQALYRFLVAEPYKFDRPALGRLAVDGRISGELTLSGGKGALHARGRAYWRKGRLTAMNGSVSLSGIDLDLPVWHQASPEKNVGPPLRGHLTVADMVLPILTTQALRLDLEADPNRMKITRPTVLDLFSGQLEIGPVTVEHLYTDRLTLMTDLSVKGIVVDSLLEGAWPQPAGTVLNGRLEPVRLEGRRLSTTGVLTTEVFGGSIDIVDPGASGLATAVPAFVFSCRINDLDLEQMTAGTDFGKIQGILRGTINRIEIVDGQPQRFNLRLETVKKNGVPQRINIRAVDNIARLGGGASPFMGMAGTFAKLFREFPYWKIGVAATLENDIFRVNGTIKEHGIEYLVKKGSFSGVNVVNLNPDNRISFKDMVKRIKRISGTQGGPVVR